MHDVHFVIEYNYYATLYLLSELLLFKEFPYSFSFFPKLIFCLVNRFYFLFVAPSSASMSKFIIIPSADLFNYCANTHAVTRGGVKGVRGTT